MTYVATYLAGVFTLPAIGFAIILAHVVVRNWRALR